MMLSASNGTLVPALSTCVWARARVGATTAWDMCTYPRSVDRWVSGAVQRSGCWIECSDVDWMLRMLAAHKDSELLDFGGNIGFYTGAAAAAGHAVSVFEPSPDNAMHLLATVRHNGWRHVTLFTLCVSDSMSPCVLSGHRDNQGSLQHDMGYAVAGAGGSGGGAAPTTAGAALTRAAKHPKGWRRGMVTTMAVRVDDVLPPRARPTFLKIDIEGSECAAFRGMVRLLNESERIIGALVEFDKSHKCCNELIQSPTGAFWMLSHRHGLCAYQAPIARSAHLSHTSLSSLCELHGSSKQLNLQWKPCMTTRTR